MAWPDARPMQLAGNRNKRITILTISLLMAAICGLIIWRESSHRAVMERERRVLASVQASLEEMQAAVAEKEASLTEREASLSELQIEHQSLTDRITNLIAQRDHLKADNQRKRQQMDSLEQSVVALTDQLMESRHEILNLESLPQTLSGELDLTRKQLTALEASMDAQAQLLSDLPDSRNYAGVSADKKVFALEGGNIPDERLPWSVYLFNREGIILEGWISRLVDGKILGHAAKWHQAASALVKGEKVFILPGKNHEQRN